jgi:hypothetical protein
MFYRVLFLAACAIGVSIASAPVLPARGIQQASASGTTVQGSATASVVSRFTGVWKEDLSKRTGALNARLTFRRNTTGALEELRGPEARPLVQPATFTAQPYAIDEGRNMIAWKQIDATTFERTLFDANQRLLTTRRIHIAADGKTLTENTEAKTADGRPTMTTIVFRRTSAESDGLAGGWKAASLQTDTPPQMKYEAAGANGLKVTDQMGTTYTPMLDGQPVPHVGSNVISGTTTAAKQVDDRTIEFTLSRGNVASVKNVRTVSADGKTMTVTSTNIGPHASDEPVTTVWVKQ